MGGKIGFLQGPWFWLKIDFAFYCGPSGQNLSRRLMLAIKQEQVRIVVYPTDRRSNLGVRLEMTVQFPQVSFA